MHWRSRFGDTTKCMNWTVISFIPQMSLKELLPSDLPRVNAVIEIVSSIRHSCIKATLQIESVGCATNRELYVILHTIFTSYLLS
jgi:hypothetical protein